MTPARQIHILGEQLAKLEVKANEHAMKTYLRVKIIGSLPASKALDPILRNMRGPERRQ
jgi:hypothetical protein